MSMSVHLEKNMVGGHDNQFKIQYNFTFLAVKAELGFGIVFVSL